MFGAERMGGGSGHLSGVFRTHKESMWAQQSPQGWGVGSESGGPAKGQTLKGSCVKAPVWRYHCTEERVEYRDQREDTIGV